VQQLATESKSFCSAHDSPCGGFMAIPPLVRSQQNGQLYINPDFDYVKRFYLVADEQGGVVPAGGTRDFAFTVPAEENHLGDLLVSELRATFAGTPGTPVRGIFTELLSLQSDRLYQNAPIENTVLWGDGFLNCCMPCCFLLQATNTLIIRVTNTEAVPVACTFTAVGKRFLPYHYPELREKYLAYWNQIPCTPYYLTLDRTEVTVAPGATVTEGMTVPGGGDFEVMWPRASVITAAGTDPDTDIFISVAEGVGRRWENEPMPLGLQASISRAVAGMPNEGTYAASQACPCPQPTQLYKRNTRIRVQFENRGAAPATIRYTMAGCMHYVSECPPGRSLDRIRSLEPTVGPFLVQQERCPPWQQMEPVPGRGFQPLPGQRQVRPMPSAIPGPGTGFLQVQGPGGATHAAQQGGPMAYLSKYYARDQHGRVVPSQPGASSHYMGGMGGVDMRRL
jgi:hypothetical protein